MAIVFLLSGLIAVKILFCSVVSGLHIFDARNQHEFDLINSLKLFNNTYEGVTVVEGIHTFTQAILLKGENRHLELPSDMVKKVMEHLSKTNEFTFIATLKQEEKNTGTIISFSGGNDRFLEIQSSGRKDEIRLHYTHKTKTFVETFPYHLADNRLHHLALSFSGSSVTLYIDCNPIYRRLIHDIDLNVSGAGNNVSLWLGQRNQQFLFKGYLQDVKILVVAHGFLLQCPNLDGNCPTCGQFEALKKTVFELQQYIKELTERLETAEHHIANLKQCECEKSCFENGFPHPDGSSWKKGCDICSCVHGDVVCVPVSCPEHVNCKNPLFLPGECCPVCLKKCLFESVSYDHGEEVHPVPCAVCRCKDGSMHCRRIDPAVSCPKLTCPLEEQFHVPDECCKFCPGMDFCGEGHDCHENATCLNLKTTYTCQCHIGYEGDGRQICTDINECLTEGGFTGHHCHHLSTICVNFDGGYKCECLPGYKQYDKYSCVEIDECSTGEHNCSNNAICLNTIGSYHCFCQDGYAGNGHACAPVCAFPCLNGGTCIAPETCSCLYGYVGSNCETDVDECSLGLHMCHSNSHCVNMPGWYFCQCQTGYQSLAGDKLGALCQDVDECLIGSHTCDLTALCINEEGSYRCECLDNSSCIINCLYYNEEHLNGEAWSIDSCTTCHCSSGVVSCHHVECDCSKDNVNFDCCPHCDHLSSCKHQEAPKTFQNGDRWIYQCQTCECLHGEIDCWDLECPPIICENPVQRLGDCCPRCDTDPCLVSSNFNNSQTQVCAYGGLIYKPGEKVPLTQDPCSSCHCQVPFCQRSVSNMAYSYHRMDIFAVNIIVLVMAAMISLLSNFSKIMTLPLAWLTMLLMRTLICIKAVFSIIPIFQNTLLIRTRTKDHFLFFPNQFRQS